MTVFGTDILYVIQCNMLTVEVNSVSFLCHLNTFGNVQTRPAHSNFYLYAQPALELAG